MTLIVTRPQHDVTTKYISAWAEDIIAFAKSKGLSVIDLVKQKANRKEFESRLNKLSPRVIFFNGHGDDETVTGHDNQPLMKRGENHEYLLGKITYALSCRSAKALGQTVAGTKESTYIGYEDDFTFVCNKDYITKPKSDPRAKPFMDCSNQVMLALLKNHTAQEATERARELFEQKSMELSLSTANQDDLQAAQCLWWNMNRLKCLGDTQAKM